ncbi:MAG: carboxypeptidase regulatory-like domain-containing protein [Abditibacteriota bacterium]|nr:carboxypeptidase regulatory-like domain-containing protein [Abditibacteriota bacterium]
MKSKLFILAFLLSASAAFSAPGIQNNTTSKLLQLRNGRMLLKVNYASVLNPFSLTDIKTGRVYADGDYEWGVDAPTVSGNPAITRSNGDITVVFTGVSGDIKVTLTYKALSAYPDTIYETVKITNRTASRIDTSAFGCGFTKTSADCASTRFCDIPFRRHNETGQLNDYTVSELFSLTPWYSTMRSPMYSRRNSDRWGAEGWAWYNDSGNTLLISKYNGKNMEWSLVKPMGDKIRFGGAGSWKMGDPEGALGLAALDSFTFGDTRYKILDGDYNQAYYDYREHMAAEHNCVIDPNYDPPINWNELYDNPLWTVYGDSMANRYKCYRRADMEIEIQKAAEIGCTAFYMDPGWDANGFGSFIWGTDRLGTQESFIAWMRETYGIERLCLHTPLAPWCDLGVWPSECRQNGGPYVCVASRQYRDAVADRLGALAIDGMYQYLFDGSWYEGNCYDATHGHNVPQTRQDHIDGILSIIRAVNMRCPDVVVEQHDMITGPGTPKYVPMYLFYGIPYGIEEVWAHEYMNTPLADIQNGLAISLYYNNLALEIPLYLHIDLDEDNVHATALWWYLSCCRHLGFGGKPSDNTKWENQKAAVAEYKADQRFYSHGKFYGLGENIHAHTLADERTSVINIFNLSGTARKVQKTFTFEEIGLEPGVIYGDDSRITAYGDRITLETETLPAWGNTRVRVAQIDPSEIATLSGTVTLEGVPAADIDVRCGGITVKTDANGVYGMTFMRSQEVQVSVALPKYLPQTAAVTVTAGEETVCDFDLVRDPNISVLTGTVTDFRNGNPVSGATVTLEGGGSGVTGADGTYEIVVERTGGCGVTASKVNYSAAESYVTLTGGDTTTKDFALAANGLRWNVYDDFSETDNPNGVWTFGFTDGSGVFTPYTECGDGGNGDRAWRFNGDWDNTGYIGYRPVSGVHFEWNHYREPYMAYIGSTFGSDKSTARFTAPYDGTFDVSAAVSFNGNGGVGVYVYIDVNGVNRLTRDLTGYYPANATNPDVSDCVCSDSFALEMRAGDTVDVYTYAKNNPVGSIAALRDFTVTATTAVDGKEVSTLAEVDACADGTPIAWTGEIVAVGKAGGEVYASAPNRLGGLRLVTDETVNEGDRLTFNGTLCSDSGGRYVKVDSLTAAAGEPLRALGYYSSFTPENVLVRVWGKVTKVAVGSLEIDNGKRTINITVPAPTGARVGGYVTVTGIAIPEGILARTAGDVISQ